MEEVRDFESGNATAVAKLNEYAAAIRELQQMVLLLQGLVAGGNSPNTLALFFVNGALYTGLTTINDLAPVAP